MTRLRMPCVRNWGTVGLSALLVLALLIHDRSWRTAEGDGPNRPSTHQSLGDVLAAGAGKRLDHGTIDLFQAHAAEPTGWVFVEDSTLDGNGVEYWIYSESFIPASPTNDKVSVEFDFVDGVNHPNLQACLDWIVATNPYITTVNDLEIQLHAVTTQ